MDIALFRQAMGRFTTGVCVVATTEAGQQHAMTANSVTSVSLEPPLMLVCVERESRFHEAILDSGVWGVSVLSVRGRPAAEWFATRGRPLYGQFDQIAHHRGKVLDVPLLDDAVSWFECRTTEVMTAGDHSVVLGEVLRADLAEPMEPALIHHRRAYRHLD